ncbi:MAG: hypothetical protein B6I18_08715 [Bacteroidetes bacterium 4572_112]|nr:MAG: hypothetical protein B6I18_08715 [Bacteroidetes bacterium 4572_112]
MDYIKRNYLKILAFISILVIAFSFNNLSLWDQDEAAYAGFAERMIATGNWLVPDYMWSFIHRKTPLHFWNIAISYKIFGINEFAVRFPSTLSIIGIYLMIYFWGARLFGKRVATIASLVLATTLFVPSLGKISVTDATLMMFTTLSAFSILQVLDNKSWKAVAVFWIAFSMALITKGPPIIIFTSIFIFILFVLHPKRKNLFRLHPWFFLPIAVAPLFIWGYLASQSDGGVFIDWLIDWYILKRISGSVLGQTGAPGLHLLFTFVFFIPYFMFFPKALWNGISGIWNDKGERFLLGAWFVAGWLIWEFSPSKLPAYTVAAQVPLAILIAKIAVKQIDDKSRSHKALIISHFVLLMLLSIGLTVASFFLEMDVVLKSSFIALVILMIVGIVIFAKRLYSDHFMKILIGINLVFQFMLWVVLMPQVDNYKNSTKLVGEYIANNAPENSAVIIGNVTGHPPSLVYYASFSSDNITEDQDIEDLIAAYESDKPTVLILTYEQSQQLLEKYPNAKVKSFISFFVDRKGKAGYYVIVNVLRYTQDDNV